jgi:hypothetical protein
VVGEVSCLLAAVLVLPALWLTLEAQSGFDHAPAESGTRRPESAMTVATAPTGPQATA